jgi:hypothetical protein
MGAGWEALWDGRGVVGPRGCVLCGIGAEFAGLGCGCGVRRPGPVVAAWVPWVRSGGGGVCRWTGCGLLVHLGIFDVGFFEFFHQKKGVTASAV